MVEIPDSGVLGCIISVTDVTHCTSPLWSVETPREAHQLAQGCCAAVLSTRAGVELAIICQYVIMSVGLTVPSWCCFPDVFIISSILRFA